MQSHTDFLGYRRYNFLTFIPSYQTILAFQKYSECYFKLFLFLFFLYFLIFNYIFHFSIFCFLLYTPPVLYSLFHSFLIALFFFNILSLYLNILISFLTVLTETLQRILHKPQIYKGRVGLPVHILYIRS